MDEPGFGRTRWRRFGLLMLLSGGLSAGMLALVANGAMAVGFSVSGQQFKVGADKLVATGFEQYGYVDSQVDPGSSDPDSKLPQAVAVSAMKTASITNLCQSVLTDLGPLGKVTLLIHAGDNGQPVTATNMVVDMTQLSGDADFHTIEIGRDASTLDQGPTNDPDELAQRQQSFFGQQAESVTITNLKQTAWSTVASEFNLKHMSLSLKMSDDECF
jgi:hypothetical protein